MEHQKSYKKYLLACKMYDIFREDNKDIFFIHASLLNCIDSKIKHNYSMYCTEYDKNKKQKILDTYISDFKKYNYSKVVDDKLQQLDYLYDNKVKAINKYNKDVCSYVNKTYGKKYDYYLSNNVCIGMGQLHTPYKPTKDDNYYFDNGDKDKFHIMIKSDCLSCGTIPEFSKCHCPLRVESQSSHTTHNS